MWGKYEISIKSWLRRIRNKNIQAPGRPPILMLHHPTTLEASTRPTEKHFLKKFHTFWLPPIGNSSSHWYVVCGYCTSQPTKTSIGVTHTTTSSSSCVHSLWPQISPLSLIHIIWTHQIYVGGQTQSTSRSCVQMSKETNSQTWSCLTSHEHSINVVLVNISPEL